MGRIRKIKDAEILVKQYPWLISTSKLSYFSNHNPLEIEIGSGKGNFLITKALTHPNINFIGIEKDATVMLKTLKKITTLESKPNNLLLINDNAKHINNWFAKSSIRTIYLNFSDPWPKRRHEKHRLTYIHFLNNYYDLLVHKGMLEFKTDNPVLYSYTIDSLKIFKKFHTVYQTEDLYKDLNELKNNVQTEYENKFVKQGIKIKKIKALK